MTRILPLTETTDPAAVADQSLVYSKDVGGVTQVFARNSDGVIVALGATTGIFALPEAWAYPNVPANQTTALPLFAQVSGINNEVRMVRSGSIVGLTTRFSEAITAGSLTVTVTKNGTPVTLAAVHTSGTGTQVTQNGGIDTYVAGDLIGVQFTTNNAFLPVTTDLEAWVQVAEGLVGGSVAASGGVPAWAAGSYVAGQSVYRGPYVWSALTTTSEDPFLVEGNLGNNSDWTFVASGAAGTVQTPGASDGAPDGKILMINNVLGVNMTTYRQRVESGFLGKMIAVDLRLSGAADGVYFGVFDSSLAQTNSNLEFASSGFYGVYIDIFNNRIENKINGTAGGNVGYINGNSTNAGSAFTRWYLKMIQNGSNWDLEVLRRAWDAATGNGTLPYTAYSRYQEDDLVPIARFTNVARPSFTNWRMVIGSRTGGSSGIFEARAAYIRNIISGAWTAIARRPNGLG